MNQTNHIVSRSNVLRDSFEWTGNWFGINCRIHQGLTGIRLSWTVTKLLLPMTTPIPLYYQLCYQLASINTYPFSFICNAQKYDVYWVTSQVEDTRQIRNEIKVYGLFGNIHFNLRKPFFSRVGLFMRIFKILSQVSNHESLSSYLWRSWTQLDLFVVWNWMHEIFIVKMKK